MVVESKYGQMVHDMMDSGGMAWPMDMEDLYMLKVTFTRVNGLRIRPMDMEFILISTAAGMRASGSRINSMATA